jgi:hypothetical protein
MRPFTLFYLLTLLLGASSSPLSAQGEVMGFSNGDATPQPPYSAETVNESVQTLADGTHIKEVRFRTKTFRDSQGRSRTESFVPMPGTRSDDTPASVMIFDPVAGFNVLLNERNHTAIRTMLPSASNGISKWYTADRFNGPARSSVTKYNALVTPAIAPSSAPKPDQPQITREKLSPQEMEGLVVEGERITTVFPVNSFGNDRPVTTVGEIWTSPELKLIILSKSIDPRFGEQTTRVTNIERGEPDAALFQIPSDYTVQETGAKP